MLELATGDQEKQLTLCVVYIVYQEKQLTLCVNIGLLHCSHKDKARHQKP